MGGTPGKWNTAPKKGGEVLPSPAAAALLPGDSVPGLGTCEGGGRRLTHRSVFVACPSLHICPAGDFGMSSGSFSFESYQPAWDVPPSRGSHLLCLPSSPTAIPCGFSGLSSSACTCGSIQGCSVSKAALPSSPCVVGLIKVSVFCTGDCVGLSQAGVCSHCGSRASKANGRSLCAGKRPWGGTCHVSG